MRFENIPDEMQAREQWVCWKLVKRSGKATKVPVDAKTGKAASSTDRATWSDFQTAVEASKAYSGIGYVFAEDDPYCGIDMDGHIDEELIEYFDSYTELSQSGNGAHIICRAKLGGTGRKNDKYEVYDRGRYFVMTGEVIRQKHAIGDCQQQVDVFLEFVFGKPKYTLPEPAHMDTLDRIRASGQAAKFDALWAGDISGYGSRSEADAALLSILRFWTRGDQAESFALFAQSGLMRDKWNRADYRNRTWASINSGDVLSDDFAEAHLRQMDAEAGAIAPAPAFLIERKISPWREITTADVQRAISGTMIEELTEVLRTPTDPPLPFEIAFAKALPIFGALLAGEYKPGDGEKTVHGMARGIDRARVKIATAGGQATNIWSLLIAPSASGKDIGNLADDVLKSNGLFLGTAGSEEGIADALAENGNGVMMISEMANWLDRRHWQHKAASFLTFAWSKGFYSHVMSKRGKEPIERSSNYCYPSIMASIQPGTLQRLASVADMDSGFLGRFIMVELDNPGWHPYPSDTLDREIALAKMQAIADALLLARGTAKPPKQRYQEELVAIFKRNEAGLTPVYARLCNEYLLRIALFLMIDRSSEVPKVLDPRAIKAAEIVCLWLYANAERMLSTIAETVEESEIEAKLRSIFNVVKNKGGAGVSLGEISRASPSGMNRKSRMECLLELEDRGFLSCERRKNASGQGVLLYTVERDF